jgi:hypothetical protein
MTDSMPFFAILLEDEIVCVPPLIESSHNCGFPPPPAETFADGGAAAQKNP